jgi:ubiquinone/menaquinone biosynthesis C-methylase UbiE
MQRQPLQAQKGEIEFRKKLASQHVNGTHTIKDEFSTEEIEKILMDRMENTQKRMNLLKARDIPLSPYIELGAERGQRSLTMENEMGARGAAIDLSFDMLKSCDHYMSVFKKTECPTRICCDIHFLPFESNSIPFVFCYQFLHHFPDPGAVIQEVYRVLKEGGYFYFDEEPYKKILHLNLYNRKIYSKKTLHAGRIQKAVDYFFAREVNNEEDYGIVENDEIPIKTWKRALRKFGKKEVEIRTLHNICADVFNPVNKLHYILASLGGGVISGLCQKEGKGDSNFKTVENLFVCPSCLKEHKERKLNRHGDLYFCASCKKKYPHKNGIAFLFPYDILSELYPEEFKNLRE